MALNDKVAEYSSEMAVGIFGLLTLSPATVTTSLLGAVAKQAMHKRDLKAHVKTAIKKAWDEVSEVHELQGDRARTAYLIEAVLEKRIDRDELVRAIGTAQNVGRVEPITTVIVAQVPFEDDTEKTKNLVRAMIKAAVEVLCEDPDFAQSIDRDVQDATKQDTGYIRMLLGRDLRDARAKLNEANKKIESLIQDKFADKEEIWRLRGQVQVMTNQIEALQMRLNDPKALAHAQETIDDIIQRLGNAEIEAEQRALDALKRQKPEEAAVAMAEAEAEWARREDMLCDQASQSREKRAQNAFSQGEIAEGLVRWSEAAEHYTRAADLAPNFVRLKKACELTRGTGRYEEALDLSKRLIDAAIAEFGGDSVEHAVALNDHVACLNCLGRYIETEKISLAVIEIVKPMLVVTHPDYESAFNNLAGAFNNLAGALYVEGRYKDAENAFQKVIEFYKAMFGETDPHYAAALNNLAGAINAQGRYAEAEEVYDKVIQIYKATLGETHPLYAASLNNLVVVLQAQGRYDEAEEIGYKVIKIHKATLGKTHPKYAASLNNLAGAINAKGRYKEAEEIQREGTEIYKVTLGETHPDYATSLNNLAQVIYVQGRSDEAIVMMTQAVAVFQKALPAGHPDLLRVMKNLEAIRRKRDGA